MQPLSHASFWVYKNGPCCKRIMLLRDNFTKEVLENYGHFPIIPLRIFWKTDPSDRTYHNRKQPTRSYSVCSWELMESATILMPPSTGLSGIMLSVRTQYPRRTKILNSKKVGATTWTCYILIKTRWAKGTALYMFWLWNKGINLLLPLTWRSGYLLNIADDIEKGYWCCLFLYAHFLCFISEGRYG